MGQTLSHDDAPYLETRVEEPQSEPRGLALIAHGRLGGSCEQPVVRALADYFCSERQLRVITWNERGVGESQDGKGLDWWLVNGGPDDYNRLLREHVDKFGWDFQDFKDAELFICGYSAGSVFAGCARPPPWFRAHFQPPRYVLVSYPVNMIPGINAAALTGTYFRAVEGLVQGYGWEGCEDEPEISGVISIQGAYEAIAFYGLWEEILTRKEDEGGRKGLMKFVKVEGSGHPWRNSEMKVVEAVKEWLG